ncbi:MAG TPA: SRPBCC domain-containing protein [Acidimicrobiia bacterium]|nr:SRPBCC domain-containing protein [Acidimicrobiia bacterium]
MERARVERRVMVESPAAEAWDRIVFGFEAWFGPDSRLEPRPGGRVSSPGRAGHVTHIEPSRRLAWEWSGDGDPGWTEVEILLHPTEGGTIVEAVEILHEWEQVRFEAIGVERPGPFGVLAGVG